MAADVISEVEVLEEYRSLAQATIAKYGGHYVVRGGFIESVEGDWALKHIVIVEFRGWQQIRSDRRSRSCRPWSSDRVFFAIPKEISSS
jgi:uncharacterized protein (DUF1330 family)